MILKKLSIIILILLLFISPVRADSATVSNIAKQLFCRCADDCAMVLSECNCAFQEEMIAVIEQKLAQGQSEEQIIQFFVAQYGEQVLTDPPKRGFNLVLWVLTPAGILVVGGIIYVALKKWVRRGRDRFNNAMAEEGDEKYQHQLENELEEFTGKGFR
tara:strand:+ start:98 stop:574 length:477 start_codon:yes stop_codon:yes gene_type:complete